ncbi:DUF3592 domain-containing protein [Bradyrhizobium sp. HKCCYLS1011]|uniref:DUF3592 domain-containing protein n=1 Tax=Bradyrhizobium sp. HKCCYLS1011 TaxID=3420733 RepID=UPI003EBD2B11
MRGVFKKLSPRTFVLVFAALAGFCFLAGGRDLVERIQVLRAYEHAEGEVTLELRRSSRIGGVGRRSPYRAPAEVFDYAPLVRFETPEGAVVTVVGAVRSGLVRYQVGEKLPVYYDPRDPQQAVLGTFLEFWTPILAWTGFGLVWGLAAYGAARLIRAGRDDKRHRAKHVVASGETG